MLSLDRAAFRKLLQEGKVQRRRPEPGKVDWDKVKKKAMKDGGVYTTRQFWTKFIKGEVNKGRTKNKLHEFCDKDKICARIYHEGLRSYVWSFDSEAVKLYHGQTQTKSRR